MLQDYQVLVAFTSPVNNAILQVGDTLSLESNLGEKLCRNGNVKNVTAHVNTDVETLQADVADHETRIGIIETTLGL